MSKKKKKKNKEKKNKVILQKNKQVSAPTSTHSSPTVPEISLREKILLEKSHHSYWTAFYRRHGKFLRKGKKIGRALFKIGGITISVIFIFCLIIFIVFSWGLPDVRKLRAMNFNETTHIYDREGNILYTIYGEENRKYVPLKDMDPDVIFSTLAIEDKSFYSHFGFDPKGIIRAQLKNIQEEGISQGASTITQQLAKNIYLSPERTYDRKVKELILAMEIEWAFTKNEILEMYLNKIAYGSNAFGVEAAANTFFNKSAKDLSLLEASVLASLPKAPSYFSPYGNRKELIGYCKSPKTETPSIEDNEEPTDVSAQQNSEVQTLLSAAETQQNVEETPPVCSSLQDPNYVWGRKDYVLERMVEDGYISREQMAEAWKEGFTIKFIDPVHKIEAPHFVFYVKQLLEEKYGKELVENGGLEVRTSLDPKVQSIGEEVVKKYAATHLKRYGANNAGLVALDPKTGQVLAMVGSVNYWDPAIDGQVNVTTSLRQPGSAFKPLIYAAAIQNSGIGSGTILGDYKTVFNKNDIPHDYDGKFLGKMTIRVALGGSRNIPAIKAYYVAGEEEKVLSFVDLLGLGNLRKFKDDFNKDAEKHGWTFNYGWPMAIGSGEVPFVNLLGAYGAFANNGKYMPVTPILEVRDQNGKILETFDSSKGVQAMDPQVAYIISDMLSDVSARPAGSWRALLTIPDHNVAAKTGTSNKKIGRILVPNNDLTIGFTPSIVAGVWAGNTDGKNMHSGAYSLYTTDPIYHDFFVEVLKGKPREEFPKPEGLVFKGKEVFPSFAQNKNWDKTFRRAGGDGSQEKKDDKKGDKNNPTPFIPSTSPFVGGSSGNGGLTGGGL